MSTANTMRAGNPPESLETLFERWSDVVRRLEARLASGAPDEETVSRLLREMKVAFDAVREAVDRPLEPALLIRAQELLRLHERVMAQARDLARQAAVSAAELAGKRRALAGYRRALGVSPRGPTFVDARI